VLPNNTGVLDESPRLIEPWPARAQAEPAPRHTTMTTVATLAVLHRRTALSRLAQHQGPSGSASIFDVCVAV